MSFAFHAHIASMEGMRMSMSNERFSVNLHSGVRLCGVTGSDRAKGKSAAVKHNSKSLKSNKESKNDVLTSGVVRNKSATVNISEQGKELAKKLRETTPDEIEEKKAETREKLERVDFLNAKLREGKELSDEDREFINEELKTLSSQNYVEKRLYRITKEDADKVMAAVQDSMVQRIQMYSDMQKELEAQKDAAAAGMSAQKIAEAEQEQAQKKRIIEILEETLEEDEEEEDGKVIDLGEETSEDSDNAISADIGENSTGILQFESEETAVKSTEDLLKFRAIDLIDKNKEQLGEMLGQSISESDEVREVNGKMDAELIRTYDLFTNPELPEEEKLKMFNESQKHMRELFKDKMIATVSSRLDFDSWLIGKIEFNAHNNLHEVIKDDSVVNGLGELDMVRDFMTNANPFFDD